MWTYAKGRNVLLAFTADVGIALAKTCREDNKDAKHIARAAQIIPSHIFGEAISLDGFPEGCQADFVLQLLLILVNMVLEGPSINDQIDEITSAILVIAQLLKLNSVKHKLAPDRAAFVRYSTAQETPIPLYIGLMLHAHTCKRDLVDRISYMVLSTSCECVLQLSTQMRKIVWQQFQREQVVCPPQLCRQVFTTATAADNVDHNLCSTTAKGSFYGMTISLAYHPSFVGEGMPAAFLYSVSLKEEVPKPVTICQSTTLKHCLLLAKSRCCMSQKPGQITY